MRKANTLEAWVYQMEAGTYAGKMFADGEKIFECEYESLAFAFFHLGAKSVELFDLSHAPELTLRFGNSP